MDKLLNIQTEGIQNNGKDTYFNHRYEPTPYIIFEQLFQDIFLTPKDHFVDFGCGMGRSNFYVHHRFHCHTTGIEINVNYYNDCIQNKHAYKGSEKSKIQFECTPAQDYHIKNEQNYFYFFNPFSVEVFMKVLHSILKSYERSPRKITLISYYPDTDCTYYIDTCTPFILEQQRPIQTIFDEHLPCVPFGVKKHDPKEYFASYVLTP